MIVMMALSVMLFLGGNNDANERKTLFGMSLSFDNNDEDERHVTIMRVDAIGER